jgi:hypothetical protein
VVFLIAPCGNCAPGYPITTERNCCAHSCIAILRPASRNTNRNDSAVDCRGPSMSDSSSPANAGDLLDTIALAVQKIHAADNLDTAQPLIRIDPRKEADEAPFEFDSAMAVLHCRGCRAIPVGSRSTLYAVWKIERNDLGLACRKCRPMANNSKPDRPADVGDVLLGLVSFVDQFSSILSQRGQDFRRTQRGHQVEQSLSDLLGVLSRMQEGGVNLLTTGVDRLLSAVNQYNQSTNGHKNGAAKGKAQTSRRGGAPEKKNARRKPPKPSLSLRN